MWIIYALIIALLWGSGYTLMIPIAKQLTPYTIATLYGAGLVIVNFIAGVYAGNVENYYLLSDTKIGLCFTGYLICMISGNFLYLAVYRNIGQNAGAFVSITSSYPMFTFILSTLIFQQKTNLYYTIPALLFISLGVILLSIAPK